MQEIILKDNKSNFFDLISYPDGQHNIKLNLEMLNVKEGINIKCRIKNFSELEVLLCLVSALDRYDFYIEEITFVYLFGMRSDRTFSDRECNYWRSVVAPIVNHIASFCDNSFVMMPHSLNALSKIKGTRYVNVLIPKSFNSSNKTIIFGDKSACEHGLKHFIFGNQEFVSFEKFRDKDNLKIMMHPQMLENLKMDKSKKPILIFDDICDGGATFIEEAKLLKLYCPDRKLELFVAHGIFSKGLSELFSYFDKIHTTNSYQDFSIKNPEAMYYQARNILNVIKVI